MKCQKCGRECRIGTEQVGIDANNIPVFHRFAYCDSCMIKTDIDAVTYEDINRNRFNYNLGLVSLLCSIAGMCSLTLGIGMLISPIALYLGFKAVKRGSIYKKSAIAGIIISGLCTLFSVLFIVFLVSNKKSIDAEQSINKIVEVEEEYTASEDAIVEQKEVSNEVEYAGWKVEYLNFEIGKDKMDNQVLIVYFNFTNNSEENQAFTYAFSDIAFQKGVELEPTYWQTNQETENANKKIQSGTTIKVATTYAIEDLKSPVTVELSPFNIWSDKVLMSLEFELE